jgi:hypothetical protein
VFKLNDGFHCRCGAILATKRVWLKHAHKSCALAYEDVRRQRDDQAREATTQAIRANRRSP